SLLVLIPFLVGIVFGSVLDLAERFSLKREVKRLRKELAELEEPSPPV
ncbi:MAG: LapA family protein, partial [Deltaproteobacteria bacterium]|nr:LapA family protein [Deltaproteobacteria bacterium]